MENFIEMRPVFGFLENIMIDKDRNMAFYDPFPSNICKIISETDVIHNIGAHVERGNNVLRKNVFFSYNSRFGYLE